MRGRKEYNLGGKFDIGSLVNLLGGGGGFNIPDSNFGGSKTALSTSINNGIIPGIASLLNGSNTDLSFLNTNKLASGGLVAEGKQSDAYYNDFLNNLLTFRDNNSLQSKKIVSGDPVTTDTNIDFKNYLNDLLSGRNRYTPDNSLQSKKIVSGDPVTTDTNTLSLSDVFNTDSQKKQSNNMAFEKGLNALLGGINTFRANNAYNQLNELERPLSQYEIPVSPASIDFDLLAQTQKDIADQSGQAFNVLERNASSVGDLVLGTKSIQDSVNKSVENLNKNAQGLLEQDRNRAFGEQKQIAMINQQLANNFSQNEFEDEKSSLENAINSINQSVQGNIQNILDVNNNEETLAGDFESQKRQLAIQNIASKNNFREMMRSNDKSYFERLENGIARSTTPEEKANKDKEYDLLYDNTVGREYTSVLEKLEQEGNPFLNNSILSNLNAMLK